MRTRTVATVLCLLAALALASALSACGEDEEETSVAEGEPVELANLSYNIGLTRFLNPDDNEDKEYLVGLPPPPRGTAYLGVFLTIDNETDIDRPSASKYSITDTLDTEYDTLESKSPYALEVGSEVPAEEGLPLEDTTPQAGFNQGSLLIFLVADSVSDNRPLMLNIETYAGSGEVKLDI